MDSYLTLVPRGLQHVFVERIQLLFQESGHSLTDIRLIGERNAEQEEDYRQHLNELLQKRKKQHSARIGTVVEDSDRNQHVSVGYDDQRGGRTVWTFGGYASSVWVSFATDAPRHFVGTQVRCIGPLLATVGIWEEIDLVESQSLEQAKTVVRSLAFSKTHFDRAVNLWHAHVHDSWPQRQDLDEDVANKKVREGEVRPMLFRLSCLRAQSKQYSYTREDFVRAIANHIISPKDWKVDLSNYDVEVVLLVKSKCLAVGLSLRPYRQLGAKDFSTGVLPSDVTPPYLSGGVLSGLLRLRPTTAQLFWQLVKLSPGDVVLDPCAGIGTIPLEVPPGVVGIGGDLILNNNPRTVAAQYLSEMQQCNQSCRSDLLAWDAAMLPLRSSCVDMVVSDLPFGQQCLSSTKLAALLPLLLGEAGRVLRPDTGSMLLLCGSFAPVLDTLQQLNSMQQSPGLVWILPCEAVIPINIGGLMAWVIKVQRGPGEASRVPNHTERSRKLMRKRERVDHLRKIEASRKPTTKDGRSKYRRLQS